MSLSCAFISQPVGLDRSERGECDLLYIDVVLDFVPVRLLWFVLLIGEEVVHFAIHL